MEHMFSDTRIAALAGILGGMVNYLLKIGMDQQFISKLIEAGATAFICGFLGVMGKHIFTVIKKKWSSKKKNNVGKT